MNAKEYLQQVKVLDVRIKQKIEEKEDLLRRARNISAVDYSREKRQTVSSNEAAFAKITDRVCDLETEINSEIDEFVNLKHTIINRIHELSDSRHVELLYKRYVEYKSYEQIALEMAYSLAYVKELHKKALADFESSYPILLLSVV